MYFSLIPLQLINSTVIRELFTLIVFSEAQLWGPISGGLYPGAYTRGLISGVYNRVLISLGIYPGGFYPGAYIRGLISGGIYPGDLQPGAYNRGDYIRRHIFQGLIAGGLYTGLLSGTYGCPGGFYSGGLRSTLTNKRQSFVS